MARRSKDWEEGLCNDLWSEPENRKYFVRGLEEEGLSFVEAIARTVSSMGLSRYADEIGMNKSNLSNALKAGGNPTIGTLEKIIEPLGIVISSKEAKAG